jgi:predicted RNA-binding protein with PUA-like domain
MRYWLFKSEPFKWSWEMQVAAADSGTHWNGVRNHLAKIQLQTMKIGDLGFFYHSNEGKEIVGLVEVIREYYPDPTDETGKFCMVDIKAVRALKRPVTLAEIKTIQALENMSLLKSMRLSVQPVRQEEWDFILQLSEK